MATESTYRTRAAEFNEKMGLSEPDDLWEDALIRFSVIGEEAGELLEAVNKDRNVPEELADVLITVYTGADTLDIELPEEYDIEAGTPVFKDDEREVAGKVFRAAGDVFDAVRGHNMDSVETALRRTAAYCHQAAVVLGVDLESEYQEKMDYNMQKSGKKVNGKPVDDVNGDDG